MNRLPVRLTIILLLTTAVGHGTALAQSPDSPNRDNEVSDSHVDIVARFSRELFIDLTRDKIEMTIPIDKTVDGTRMTGEAAGEGFTKILMPESDDQAIVLLRVEGDATGRLRSDVGPAVVRISSRADFTSELTLRFDGRSFTADPTESHSNNCTSVDSICAKRRGPIGCLVERIGSRVARKSLPELNRYAEESTEDLLNSTVDEQSVNLLKELNQTSQFDEIVDKHFPETRDWVYHLATRPEFLVAGLGPESRTTPEFLLAPDSAPTAHMELWLRLTPGQAAMLELLDDLNVTNDVLKGLLPEDESGEMAKDVHIDRQGEWSILRVGLLTPNQGADDDAAATD